MSLVQRAMHQYRENAFTPSECRSTRRTLNRTVFESGLHWPTVTLSPSFIRKAGEAWAEKFLCLFSYRLYFGTNCKYSLRTTCRLVFVCSREVLFTNGSRHLGRDDSSIQYSTTDRDISDEGTFFVDIFPVDSLSWGLESEANLFEPTLRLGT